jgi:hypothetical protein
LAPALGVGIEHTTQRSALWTGSDAVRVDVSGFDRGVVSNDVPGGVVACRESASYISCKILGQPAATPIALSKHSFRADLACLIITEPVERPIPDSKPAQIDVGRGDP